MQPQAYDILKSYVCCMKQSEKNKRPETGGSSMSDFVRDSVADLDDDELVNLIDAPFTMADDDLFVINNVLRQESNNSRM